jgi:hypothetical protein
MHLGTPLRVGKAKHLDQVHVRKLALLLLNNVVELLDSLV